MLEKETGQFDVLKWREEHPIDYIKAMSLINLSTNKEEVFISIYKVTRLHIPEILYKYHSLDNDIRLNELKLDTLLSKKVFMSDAEMLNDPFDSKGFFYRASELNKYERLAEYGGKLIDDFSKFQKVTALTANGVSSMPMWAHYANNHCGYCVSYDMQDKENIQLSSCTFPVQYTTERIDVTDLMLNQARIIHDAMNKHQQTNENIIMLNDLSLVIMPCLFCNIKHSSWSYENEFRCTTGATAEGMPYTAAIPNAIYIGMKCMQTYRERLIEISKSLGIPAYLMDFDEYDTNYNIVPKLVSEVNQ